MHAGEANELTDGAVLFSNVVEDATTRRFGDHIEHLKSSGHSMSIHQDIYMARTMRNASFVERPDWGAAWFERRACGCLSDRTRDPGYDQRKRCDSDNVGGGGGSRTRSSDSCSLLVGARFRRSGATFWCP